MGGAARASCGPTLAFSSVARVLHPGFAPAPLSIDVCVLIAGLEANSHRCENQL